MQFIDTSNRAFVFEKTVRIGDSELDLLEEIYFHCGRILLIRVVRKFYDLDLLAAQAVADKIIEHF